MLIIIAVICLLWYIVVALICTIGFVQLQRHYSRRPKPPRCIQTNVPRPPRPPQPPQPPHITIIRPVKGYEPKLYSCLASTFRQTYPRNSLTICFCVESKEDPSFPILQELIRAFPEFDTALLVEEEDAELQGCKGQRLGPNPKIRNMSRAYREAKGDIVWVIDCNVWVGPGVAGRMVDTLCGTGGRRKYKFVHQLPLVVDVETSEQSECQRDPKSRDSRESTSCSRFTRFGSCKDWFKTKGGRLEEMFLATSHAKFYTAINTVSIAPCIVGKSNMFRRSHLNALTKNQGIDYFSRNICEDHMIGDLLWKSPVPPNLLDSDDHDHAVPWGQHALCFGDLAIQPMSRMSVSEYFARRVRWLRVRKYTVTLATLAEPGTESFLCSAYGAFAITTLPWFQSTLGIAPTWTAFATFWLMSVLLWALVDYNQYKLLHSGASLEWNAETSLFVQGQDRSFAEWFLAWVGRETLAFPIWLWAAYGGASVNWRGRDFWVDMHMNVHEIRRKNSVLKDE
ncbi:ceramide glucosyltransferase-like protein [Eremomyces bilateralis CBS 781.70]|uniref:Ceramide glucosyltransferase n=1 Tax=Eremomyces bilateralis CBS 781.70 TaxID=1392243 RepID=A0A6G1GHH2_9PEZI|nr:ceramide glucosyltransferase-like protein [Eremomyces bilateralis CBS 781.70]KAF1817545.1 ceramide glucosyltransferase-like protein [Eremomyces bilateralis CBS 781.70]